MVKVVRVTKIFSFEMAHMLYNHDKECKNIHGHSYKLYVTVRGKILNENKNPKNGMVLDFSDLKKIINKNLIDFFDHSLVINKNSPNEQISTFLNGKGLKIVEVDYQTTCENIVFDFAKRIKTFLPDNLELYSLKLYETENSYTEWYMSDND